MIAWSRGNVRPLSVHFNSKEFVCRCGICIPQRITQDLINKLEQVRQLYGLPVTITSGFRCQRYQGILRGKGLQTAVGTSTHELGQAADITGADLPLLAEVCKKVFKAVGIASNFVHVDTRADK